MTAKMRAIRLDAVGPPENLALVEIDRPELTPDGIEPDGAHLGCHWGTSLKQRN